MNVLSVTGGEAAKEKKTAYIKIGFRSDTPQRCRRGKGGSSGVNRRHAQHQKTGGMDGAELRSPDLSEVRKGLTRVKHSVELRPLIRDESDDRLFQGCDA